LRPRNLIEKAVAHGLTVIVDTREQTPWNLSRFNVTTIRGTLQEGDYALKDAPCAVALERKSEADYYGTLFGSDANKASRWDRFTRELERLAAYDYAAIIVESSPHQFDSPYRPTRAATPALYARTTSILTDYRIPVIFAGTRAAAETLAVHLLARQYLRHHGLR
jgi:DNA excision repair protein ERCC-4